jgi:hypothetical protein
VVGERPSALGRCDGRPDLRGRYSAREEKRHERQRREDGESGAEAHDASLGVRVERCLRRARPERNAPPSRESVIGAAQYELFVTLETLDELLARPVSFRVQPAQLLIRQ